MNFKGLGEWFQERFPVMNFISGFMLYILPKSIAHLTTAGAIAWHWTDIFAAMIPALHLFILRVFDEHKDYQSDLVNNPNRVLQRGIVSLKQIRTLGIYAAVFEYAFLTLVAQSPVVWIAYTSVWIWTLLMWKEFFAAEWLKRHFFLYGFSHLLITPLVLFLCAAIAGTPMSFAIDLVILGILTSWIYEVSRKTKAPDEETGDTSYSKMWGTRNSCTVIAVQGALIAVVAAAMFAQLQILNLWTATALSLTLLLHFASIAKFVREPSPKARKSNEGTSALMSLVTFVAPVIADLIFVAFH